MENKCTISFDFMHARATLNCKCIVLYYLFHTSLQLTVILILASMVVIVLMELIALLHVLVQTDLLVPGVKLIQKTIVIIALVRMEQHVLTE